MCVQSNFTAVIMTGNGILHSFSTSPGQHLVRADEADGVLFVLARSVIQWNEN